MPSQSWTHEYQAISGHGPFCKASQELLLGSDLYSKVASRIVSLQSLSGTGACRLGCEFLSRFHKPSGNDEKTTILFPNPTWGNHHAIAKDANMNVKTYRYLDLNNLTSPQLDLDGMLEDLSNAPKGSIIMLHMCAHNPTGVDPTLDQWRKIAQCCKDNELQIFFDNAYQGFASGNLNGDAKPLQMMVGEEFNMSVFVACSFAKNMGLYGERIGALHVIAPDEASANNVFTQLKTLARAMYSNPPQFGAMVAHKVMTEANLRSLWEEELKGMAERINKMRWALREQLEKKVSEQKWNHITDQIGMFSYTGLTPEQVNACTERGVFMLGTGRISMAGLNESNVDHVADVMASAIQSTK